MLNLFRSVHFVWGQTHFCTNKSTTSVTVIRRLTTGIRSEKCFVRHAVGQSVEALRYKPEGRGSDSRWCHLNFSLTYPSGRTMTLGSTQSLVEMSTRNISWGVKAAGTYGWQPYHLHVPIVLKSGSLSLLEPSGPVQACNGIALTFTLVVTGFTL